MKSKKELLKFLNLSDGEYLSSSDGPTEIIDFELDNKIIRYKLINTDSIHELSLTDFLNRFIPKTKADELIRRVNVLNNLLQNPEKGCFTWHMAVNENLKWISEFYQKN